MTDNLANFSAYLDDQIRARIAAMPREELEAELLLMHRVIKVAEEVGEAVGALIGLTGANPRKGVTHTPQQVVQELHDVAVAAEGAAEHMLGNQGDALPGLEEKVDAVTARAGLVDAHQECGSERLSWDFFPADHYDRYYLRCNRIGAHDEHKNDETGVTWTGE